MDCYPGPQQKALIGQSFFPTTRAGPAAGPVPWSGLTLVSLSIQSHLRSGAGAGLDPFGFVHAVRATMDMIRERLDGVSHQPAAGRGSNCRARGAWPTVQGVEAAL
jgi:hypothetical protein